METNYDKQIAQTVLYERQQKALEVAELQALINRLKSKHDADKEVGLRPEVVEHTKWRKMGSKSHLQVHLEELKAAEAIANRRVADSHILAARQEDEVRILKN